MVADRNWRGLAGFILGCVAVSAPFLARNILLSGWLIYPFPWLDLFAVDWKIPSLVAISDAAAIRAYALFGEAWNYACLSGGHLSLLKQWFAENAVWIRMAMVANMSGFLVYGLFGVWQAKRAEWRYDGVVWGTALAGFSYMMLTAPSVRFGIWWAFAGMALGCWAIAVWVMRLLPGNAGILAGHFAKRSIHGLCMVYALAVFMKLCAVARGHEGGVRSHLVFPADYPDGGATAAWMEMGGQRFYYHLRWPGGPNDGGLNGYAGFPGTECRTLLERIEMRGGDLADGFRPRSEAQNRGYDFQGRWLDEEELALLRRKP